MTEEQDTTDAALEADLPAEDEDALGDGAKKKGGGWIDPDPDP